MLIMPALSPALQQSKKAKDMLTLTVKDNETLHIGDDIKIVIKKSSGSGNKVCIDAPEAVKILRDRLVR